MGPARPPVRKPGAARLLYKARCAHGGPQGVLAMRPASLCCAVLGGAALLAAARAPAPAEARPEKYQTVVAKGLDWLARNQSRDGHWEAFGGQYPVTMTALSGMAMLMEGSTIREGKYRDHIRRAVD